MDKVEGGANSLWEWLIMLFAGKVIDAVVRELLPKLAGMETNEREILLTLGELKTLLLSVCESCPTRKSQVSKRIIT